MFRKHYKEAMDSIKPDEDFVSTVISNAKKRKPPAYRQYVKYAAVAAAGVAVVSAAVLSMPLWQRIDTSKDGIIIEETVSQTTAPSAAAMQAGSIPSAAPDVPTFMPQTPEPPKTQPVGSENTKSKKSVSSNRTGGGNKTWSNETPDTASAAQDFSNSVRSYVPPAVENTQTAEEEPSTESVPAEKKKSVIDVKETENSVLQSEVEDTSDYDQGNSQDENAVMYSIASSGAAPEMDASTASSSKRTADSDIPAPSGYYCTSASSNGYTFENGEGAVIVVTITYGGEETAPYISEDGDSIYAVVCSYGMCVTVSASGADRGAVEEIIYSF